MKTNKRCGLLALFLLCILAPVLSAQTTSTDKAAEVAATPAAFEYSEIGLSDPAIYAGEPFSISLMVKNTSSKESKQEVRLMVRDESAHKGQRKLAGKFLTLDAGESEMLTFTLRGKDLLKKGEKAPDHFVFFLGGNEIGVAFVKE